MTYHGKVKDGIIVLDSDTHLPEGADVKVELALRTDTLAQRLLRFAGKAKGLPTDAARNNEHYLYGVPKR